MTVLRCNTIFLAMGLETYKKLTSEMPICGRILCDQRLSFLRFSHQENLAFAHRADWYAVARFMCLWGERIGVRSLPMIPPMPQPNPSLLSPQKHINSDWVRVHSQGGGREGAS